MAGRLEEAGGGWERVGEAGRRHGKVRGEDGGGWGRLGGGPGEADGGGGREKAGEVEGRSGTLGLRGHWILVSTFLLQTPVPSVLGMAVNATSYNPHVRRDEHKGFCT